MALPNYPNNPQVNDTFLVGDKTFQWDGEKWKALSNADNSLRTQLAGVNSTVLVGGVEAQSISKRQVSVEDFLSVAANHKEAINLAIEEAKTVNATKIVLPDQTLNIINDEAGGIASYAAAIVIDGLENCEIVGSGTNSELRAATGGSGTTGFGIFRVQNCNNLCFKKFRIEGDFANHPTDGGNVSTGIILATFDRDSVGVDLNEMRGLTFDEIECNNIGGFIWVARRGSGLIAPSIYGVKVTRCFGVDAALSNNTIGFNWVVGGEVKYNRFENTPALGQFPSLFVDCSRGCENITVEKNYGKYFIFGMKSEGSAAGETYYPSKNIDFIGNELLEIGDPESFSGGSGGSAGATYAIKMRSEGGTVRHNKYTARTWLVTSGGLNTGIFVVQNDILKGNVDISFNEGEGALIGVIHNKITSDKLTKCHIAKNKISAVNKGVLFQADCDVDDNDIFDTSSFAIDMQKADNSRARRNRAFDCGATNGDVYNQGGAGGASGYFEFIDNEIVDTRGASAADNGYVIQSGLNYTLPYKVKAGYTEGLQSNLFAGDYIGLFENSDVKYSGQVNGSTLAVTNGFNIDSVTSVDANTLQINFKRPIPSDITPSPTVSFVGGNVGFILFGNTENYIRLRFVDSSGALTTPPTFNIKSL